MTLVELFGKYYNGELTNEEEIKRIFKEEVNFFSVIHPTDITDDGLYSIGDDNALLDVEVEYENYEDFYNKLDSFLDIIFTDSSLWGWSKLLKTEYAFVVTRMERKVCPVMKIKKGLW